MRVKNNKNHAAAPRVLDVIGQEVLSLAALWCPRGDPVLNAMAVLGNARTMVGDIPSGELTVCY